MKTKRPKPESDFWGMNLDKNLENIHGVGFQVLMFQKIITKHEIKGGNHVFRNDFDRKRGHLSNLICNEVWRKRSFHPKFSIMGRLDLFTLRFFSRKQQF